jgi:hypothetical protein
MLRDNLEKVNGGYSRKSIVDYLGIEDSELDGYVRTKEVISDVELYRICKWRSKYNSDRKAKSMSWELNVAFNERPCTSR